MECNAQERGSITNARASGGAEHSGFLGRKIHIACESPHISSIFMSQSVCPGQILFSQVGSLRRV